MDINKAIEQIKTIIEANGETLSESELKRLEKEIENPNFQTNDLYILPALRLIRLRTKTAEIGENIIASPLAYLIALHKYLFESIDDAKYHPGQIRTYPMYAKGRGGTNDYFALFMSTSEEEINGLLIGLCNTNKRFNSKREYAKHIAIFFEMLIRQHPFSDGNGRTIQAFFSEFVEQYDNGLENFYLDWSKINNDFLKNILYVIDNNNTRYDNTPLIDAFEEALTPLDLSI